MKGAFELCVLSNEVVQVLASFQLTVDDSVKTQSS